MRISDWSSDVCSSGLSLQPAFSRPRQPSRPHRLEAVVQPAVGPDKEVSAERFQQSRRRTLRKLPDMKRGAGVTAQIGRAKGWERAGTNVEIVVVAEAFNKKHSQQHA